MMTKGNKEWAKVPMPVTELAWDFLLKHIGTCREHFILVFDHVPALDREVVVFGPYCYRPGGFLPSS